MVKDNRLNSEVAVNDPTLLQLRVLIGKQNGVDNHMYGHRVTSTAVKHTWKTSLKYHQQLL